MTRHGFATRPGSSQRQRGVVLYVAIIVLVAMTLAGLAMMRQMGAGASIAGNVAFKESATSVADRGTEAARVWLMVNSAALDTDDHANGYHSSWAGTVDPSQYNWAQSLTLIGLDAGNEARIYIERLCATPNMSAIAPTQVCSDQVVGTGPSRGGSGGYPGVLAPTAPKAYYRVTTRVDGPRNTRSYVQVLMRSID